MFYLMSKLFYAVARPLHFLLLLMLIGLGLQLTRRARLGLWLVNGAVVALAIAAVSPLATLVLTPLETRFPRPGLVEPAPDGIIVLGGAVDTRSEAGRPDLLSLNHAGDRLTEIPALAALYPKARIIYTGGPDAEANGIMPEARAVRALFVQFGIPVERITIEEQSMTTWENATMTLDLVNPAPGSRWLLVTSAYHMPRSVGAFRKAGWPGIIAYPTDYRTADPQFGIAPQTGVENLELLDVAMKEWYGMLGYWLGGRSSALYPAP